MKEIIISNPAMKSGIGGNIDMADVRPM